MLFRSAAVATFGKPAINHSPTQKAPPRRAGNVLAGFRRTEGRQGVLLDEQIVEGLFIILVIEAELLVVDLNGFTGVVGVCDLSLHKG